MRVERDIREQYVCLVDGIRHSEIRAELGTTAVGRKLHEISLRWFRHVYMIEDDKLLNAMRNSNAEMKR